jgi:hypothetical protein
LTHSSTGGEPLVIVARAKLAGIQRCCTEDFMFRTDWLLWLCCVQSTAYDRLRRLFCAVGQQYTTAGEHSQPQAMSWSAVDCSLCASAVRLSRLNLLRLSWKRSCGHMADKLAVAEHGIHLRLRERRSSVSGLLRSQDQELELL